MYHFFLMKMIKVPNCDGFNDFAREPDFLHQNLNWGWHKLPLESKK